MVFDDILKKPMDELKKTREGLERNKAEITRVRVQRNVLWVAEMCLKYDKKPEEIMKLLEEVDALVKKK